VTVHYVEDFQLKNYLLALKHCKQSHTAENLLDELNGIIEVWGLITKVVSISADGAYNILAKCRKLVGTFKHSTSLSEKLSEVLRKCANLYLDEEIDQQEIDEIVDMIEKSDEPHKKQLKLKLVQDMATRWNSTLAMLISIFDSHSAIR